MAIPAVLAQSAATCGRSVPLAGVSTRKSTTSRPRQCRSIGPSVAACRSGTRCAKSRSFVAVLCYSRLMFIEFTLSQRKAEFYRGVVHALNFFGGQSPRHHLRQLESRRDQWLGPRLPVSIPSSWRCAATSACSRLPANGVIQNQKESSREPCAYLKHNALAGRADELVRFEDYLAFAPRWRDQVANVRIHETTQERPIDRFQRERSMLHALPAIPYDTDEIVPAVVTPHARIEFDGNRYSVPPTLARRPVSVRADRDEVRILHEGHLTAQHIRCYQRGQLIVLPDHRLAALALSRRSRSSALEQAFDALGPEARQFHLHLRKQPVKTGVHLRRLLGLAQLYGTAELLGAISRALELATYDAAYVENLLLAERRRR